jgi:hypothetical protein
VYSSYGIQTGRLALSSQDNVRGLRVVYMDKNERRQNPKEHNLTTCFIFVLKKAMLRLHVTKGAKSINEYSAAWYEHKP